MEAVLVHSAGLKRQIATLRLEAALANHIAKQNLFVETIRVLNEEDNKLKAALSTKAMPKIDPPVSTLKGRPHCGRTPKMKQFSNLLDWDFGVLLKCYKILNSTYAASQPEGAPELLCSSHCDRSPFRNIVRRRWTESRPSSTICTKSTCMHTCSHNMGASSSH
jgi:hypothetical protein